jgi:hypothetical protein
MGLIDRVDINCRGDWLAAKLMCGRTEPNAKHSTARKAVSDDAAIKKHFGKI